MMKNIYLTPKSEVVMLTRVELLTVSGGEKGIGYGGVDTGGTKEPSARSFDFDEDEEF